jgi:hypothetical protein
VPSTYSVQNVVSSTNASESTLTFTHSGTDTTLGFSFAGAITNTAGSITSAGQFIAPATQTFTWNGGAAMFQTSGSISAYTGTSKAAYAPLTIASATLGLVSYTAAVTSSPILTLAGSYESASTPTYAEDSWTIQNVVGTGVNGTSKLTIGHTGSSGQATVVIPTSGTLNIALGFSGGSAGLGPGINGANTLSITAGGSLMANFTTTGIQTPTSGLFGWASANNTATLDTGLSRITAGVVAIGNGTAANTSGTLELATLQFTAAASAPTSAGTAGTAGQMIYNGTNLYICTVTGAAGSATWNKFNLTAV